MTIEAQVHEDWAEFCTTMKKIERRRQRRLALDWPIRLSGGAIGSLETRTENLSSGGFYCVLVNPLAPGEQLDCEVTIPNYDRGQQRGSVGFIQCRAEVVRVETRGADPGFGIACKILDLTFIKSSGSPETGLRSQ